MPTGDGYVAFTDTNGSLRLVFSIDNKEHNFSGTFVKVPPPFLSSNAQILFESIDKVKAIANFEATIGPKNVSFVFDNGTVIGGPLDMPVSPPGHYGGIVHYVPGAWSSSVPNQSIS